MDEPCNYHTFQQLMADKEKWAQVQDVTSAGYAKYQGMLMERICFADALFSGLLPLPAYSVIQMFIISTIVICASLGGVIEFKPANGRTFHTRQGREPGKNRGTSHC